MVAFHALHRPVETRIPTDRSQPLPARDAAAWQKCRTLRSSAIPALSSKAMLLIAFLTGAAAQAVGAPASHRQAPAMQPVPSPGRVEQQAHNRTYITQDPVATPVVDADGAPVNATDLSMTLASNLELGPMAEEIHVVFQFNDPLTGEPRQVKVSKPVDMPLDAFASFNGNFLTIRVQDFQVPDRAKLVFPAGALQIPDQTRRHVSAPGEVSIRNTGPTSLPEIKVAVASDISKTVAFQSLGPLAVDRDLVAFTPVPLVPVSKEDPLIRWEFANTVALKGPHAGHKWRLFQRAQQPDEQYHEPLRRQEARIGQIESRIERIKRISPKKIEQVRKRFEQSIQVNPERRQELEQALEQAIQRIEEARDRRIELSNQRILSLQASAEALRNEKAFIEELFEDPNWFERSVEEREKIVAADIKEARKQTELGISWTPQEQAVAHMLFDPEVDPNKQGYSIPKSAWEDAEAVRFTTPDGPVSARKAGEILRENIFKTTGALVDAATRTLQLNLVINPETGEPEVNLELLAAVAHGYRDTNRDDKIKGDLLISTLLGMNDTGNPINIVYGIPPIADNIAATWLQDGQMTIIMNEELQGSAPTELSPILKHESTHQDPNQNGLFEEVFAKEIEFHEIWVQHSQLPSRYVQGLEGRPLAKNRYSGVLAGFLNSGRNFLSPGVKIASVDTPSILPNTPASGIQSLEELYRAVNDNVTAPERETPLPEFAQKILPAAITSFNQQALDAMEALLALDVVGNEADHFSVGIVQKLLGMTPFPSSLPPHIELATE